MRVTRRQLVLGAVLTLVVVVIVAAVAAGLLRPDHRTSVQRLMVAASTTDGVPKDARMARHPSVTPPPAPEVRHVPATAVEQLRSDVRRLTEPMTGRPAALRARLLGYQVDSWRSRHDFTLLVSVRLRFRRHEQLAWNQGVNARFVTFTRQAGTRTFRLEWASGR